MYMLGLGAKVRKFITESSYSQQESTTGDCRARCMYSNGSFKLQTTPRDGSARTEATLLSIFNIPHYPRYALTTLSRDYLACVIVRLSSRRAVLPPLLYFYPFASPSLPARISQSNRDPRALQKVD